MDKLRSMEIFVSVVDQGFHTAAADTFRISPVMVGKAIKQLEERVGTRLLRARRGGKPDRIGRQYVEQCRQIRRRSRRPKRAPKRCAPRRAAS